MKYLRKKYNAWLFNQLIRYVGIDLKPEPGIWGTLDQREEQETLARIYQDDLFIALLKKYAERANKSVLTSLSQLELGKFLAYNAIILKAKKAFKDNGK